MVADRGVQSLLLTQKADFVVSSDIDLSRIKLHLPHLIKWGGEFLPFKNGSFDVVYSSCVLEHVRNRRLFLSEIRRVLTINGIFICVVPTFAWKVLQVLLHYPTIVYRLIRRKKDHPKPRIRACTRYLLPSVHGEFNGNIEEARAYMIKNWVALLESNGFEICKIKKLLLYAPLGELRGKNITIVPPALKIEKLLGLSSSIMFLARPRKMSF